MNSSKAQDFQNPFRVLDFSFKSFSFLDFYSKYQDFPKYCDPLGCTKKKKKCFAFSYTFAVILLK